MDNQYVDERVSELGSQIYGLKRAVENLTQTVTLLSAKIDTKTDKDDVQQIIKQSELIKKINESSSIGMDSTVRISLDGKVIAESIAEHTADYIQGRVIKGEELRGRDK
ncbi:hypothetical protein [Bacillus sp. Fil]|uniref:hypothetical protein n=1 Tax=Bacillus sp. Fil TaxID=3459567 RepID=UPI00403AE211